MPPWHNGQSVGLQIQRSWVRSRPAARNIIFLFYIDIKENLESQAYLPWPLQSTQVHGALALQLSNTLDLIGEEFWIGLLNPNGSNCKDDNCHNQLSWASDGSQFSNRHASKINMQMGTLCTVYRDNSGNVANRDCKEVNKFACQFSCDGGEL